MKNLHKLFKYINDGYNVYLSNGSNTREDILKQYIPNYKGIPPIESIPNSKNLVIVFLTTIKDICPEIELSTEYTLKDHRSAGNENNTACITAFVKFCSFKFNEQLDQFCKEISTYQI